MQVLTFFYNFAMIDMLLKEVYLCGNSSVDRALPCQGRGRGFEPRFPLQIFSIIHEYKLNIAGAIAKLLRLLELCSLQHQYAVSVASRR